MASPEACHQCQRQQQMCEHAANPEMHQCPAVHCWSKRLCLWRLGSVCLLPDHAVLSNKLACAHASQAHCTTHGAVLVPRTCCDQCALRHHLRRLTDQVFDLAAAEPVSHKKLAPGRQRHKQQARLLLQEVEHLLC